MTAVSYTRTATQSISANAAANRKGWTPARSRDAACWPSRAFRRTSEVKCGDAFVRGRRLTALPISASFIVFSQPPARKLLAQQLARPPDARLHGSQPALQRLRDVVVTPSLDLEQRQRSAVHQRQPVQRRGYLALDFIGH